MTDTKQKPLSLFRTITVPKLIMPRPKSAILADLKDNAKRKIYLPRQND